MKMPVASSRDGILLIYSIAIVPHIKTYGIYEVRCKVRLDVLHWILVAITRLARFATGF